ncbi:SDR family NAD(P)-dependent oxidoreductase [Luteimonas sp. RD2P54]|uniref:SDR family NAD(P)-dependent oxidoreductase n=1 Tax=Luteimonas endophytica TaxID=3042023 RepID=A0ABT6J4V2_9GAMM|nr:SDR family NAD(P)-dependent oxidoreductase [Luteimonas endophytica]MDH5821845.1 SDR family NAD(P)-dependent oxidoreductase [Luteimonas endophytica]
MTRQLLVLGATGAVGRGVVAAAAASRRPVLAVSADGAGLRALRARHPDADLTTIAAPLRSEADAAALAVRLRDRALCGVIATIGTEAARGRLLDQPAEVLRRTLDEDLLPHLFAARHLFPLLPRHDRGTGYVLVGGPGGEYPWAGYGHRSIAAAALRMLARVLHDEAGRAGLRVQLLTLDTPVRSDGNHAHACAEWPLAEAVGRRALALLACAPARGAAPAVVPYASAPDLTSSEVEVATFAAAHAEGAADTAPELRDARALLDAIASTSPDSRTTPR